MEDIVKYDTYLEKLTTIDDAKGTSQPALIDEFQAFYKEQKTLFFRKLNELIYTGKYCQEHDLERDIRKHIEELKRFRSPYEFSSRRVQSVNINFIEDFSDDCREALTMLLNLLIRIKELAQPEINTHFINFSLRELFKPNLNGIKTTELNLFRINLIVCNYDHFLSNVEECPEYELREIITYLNSLPDDTSKIMAKAIYLLDKITLRKVANKNVERFEVRLLHEGNIQKFDSRAHLGAPGFFNGWIEYSLDHYQVTDDWKKSIKRKYSDIQRKGNEDLTVQEIHVKIKYYKDINKSTKGLNDLLGTINDRRSKSDHQFDVFAYEICYNYCLNNLLSLFVEDWETNEVEIRKLYKEITHDEIHHNYFPQTKYIGFLIEKLRKTVSGNASSSVFENLPEIIKTIKECEEVIGQYKDNVKWVENYYNYVFQLPHEECFVDLQEGRMFVSSSFVLPLDRKYLKREFEKYRVELNEIKSAIEVYKNTSGFYNKFLTLEKESKGRESRNFEILGLFVGIMSFTAAIIPAFKFITTTEEAIYFSLTIALALTAFAIAIRTFARDMTRKTWLTHLIYLTVYFILTGVIWWTVDYFLGDKFTDKAIKREVQKELDERNGKTLKVE